MPQDLTEREGERNWLTFEEAQKDLPPGTTIRWISKEAKRCGVWHKYGKNAVILKEGYPHFLRGEVWRESVARTSSSGHGAKRESCMRQPSFPSKKGAKSPIAELSEVRERLTGAKRKNSQRQ
ncbi:MAG: hypothetical protein WCD20_01520 [Rhodomicrobium sp.]